MKIFTRALVAALFFSSILFACKKEKEDPKPTPEPTYASLAAFYTALEVKSEFHNVDAFNGGSFTTAKGTKVTVPAACWIDDNGNPVLGNVKVELKDLYSKSDIMISGIHTVSGNNLLKSAGEFFIRAEKDGGFLRLAGGLPIKVEQPANGAVDSAMRPFIGGVGAGGAGWTPQDSNSALELTANSYIFNLYTFSNPASGGTWCNSDNAAYFAGYTKTTLTVIPDASQTSFSPDVYLIFTGVNSMVHVYKSGANFPFTGAPVGLACTIVTIGIKDGKLYSAFTPVTISTGLNVTVTMTETTTASFKTQLTALNAN